MERQNICGTLLLAQVGINGTVADSRQAIDILLNWFKTEFEWIGGGFAIFAKACLGAFQPQQRHRNGCSTWLYAISGGQASCCSRVEATRPALRLSGTKNLHLSSKIFSGWWYITINKCCHSNAPLADYSHCLIGCSGQGFGDHIV